MVACLLVVGGVSALTQFASNTLTSSGGSSYIIAIQNNTVIQVQTVIILTLAIQVKRYSG